MEVQNPFFSLCGMSDMDGIISNLTPFFSYFLNNGKKKKKHLQGLWEPSTRSLTGQIGIITCLLLSLSTIFSYTFHAGECCCCCFYCWTYARTHSRTRQGRLWVHKRVPFCFFFLLFFKLRAHFNGHIVVSRNFFFSFIFNTKQNVTGTWRWTHRQMIIANDNCFLKPLPSCIKQAMKCIYF